MEDEQTWKNAVENGLSDVTRQVTELKQIREQMQLMQAQTVDFQTHIQRQREALIAENIGKLRLKDLKRMWGLTFEVTNHPIAEELCDIIIQIDHRVPTVLFEEKCYQAGCNCKTDGARLLNHNKIRVTKALLNPDFWSIKAPY